MLRLPIPLKSNHARLHVMTSNDAQILVDYNYVVNHSTCDPGQFTMLRQLGATTPRAMNLIAFYRERTTLAA